MQHSQARKRTEWTISKIVTVIGIILLLVVASYMAYRAIDEQARLSGKTLGEATEVFRVSR